MKRLKIQEKQKRDAAVKIQRWYRRIRLKPKKVVVPEGF
jgi:hypothetical protein